MTYERFLGALFTMLIFCGPFAFLFAWKLTFDWYYDRCRHSDRQRGFPVEPRR